MVISIGFDNNDNHPQQASKEKPCLLCGGEHWCYLIGNQQGSNELTQSWTALNNTTDVSDKQTHRRGLSNFGQVNAWGDLYKIICGQTQPGDAPDEWEHSGTARDGRPIFMKKGVRRSKKRLYRAFPELIQLTPSPKPNIPEWQDVFIPLEQLSLGHTVRLKPGNPGAGVLYEVKKIELGKRQGKNCLLATLVVKGGSGGTLEIQVEEISSIITNDPDTGAKEQFIEYNYSDSLKVVRTQWSDRSEVYPGKKNKKVRPWRNECDQWIEGKGGREFPLYRFTDVAIAIRQGEVVFAVGGEQAVEVLAELGLAATTNQGGEDSSNQIPLVLAPIFQEIALAQECLSADKDPEPRDDTEKEPEEKSLSKLKPLLVIWGDNDDKGREFSERIAKLSQKNRIPHVILDPMLLWSGMPKKGDVKDWVEWCQSLGMTDEEMLYRLEMAIETAIDTSEEDANFRWQRNNWNAPTSWKGEIGKWIQRKDSPPVWQPCCNFDFQIERELQDSQGGGFVLQVKRHFEDVSQQKRVILNSTDYTSTEKFVNAMKRALGTGVCCNLTNFELNQLFAVRLHEYRTSRRGKVLRRIECYGQQEDGTWVFSDRQFTHDGHLISEDQTGWVFSDVSAEGDEIPCPSIAPTNPLALNRLVDTARLFFGNENIHQVLLTIGWVVAGLHSREIFRDKKWFPLLNMYGEPGSCKTLAGEAALSLVGSNWADSGMMSRASVSAIYEHGSKTGSLPFIWDDPARNPESEEIFKTWANRKARIVRGNRQEPKSPLGSASNHVIGGDQAATYTRMVRLAYERAASGDQFGDRRRGQGSIHTDKSGGINISPKALPSSPELSLGDNSAFTELQEAQKYASGAFPLLLQIGYPKAEIAALEKELLLHLPKAHARIAQALAIIVCYAQKVLEMSGGTEDILQWAIANLCPAEDDADSAGNSLLDFITRLQALEAIDEVGDWNKKLVTDKNTGQRFVAIYASNAWKMVDARFKPATYNEKSLKVLIDKAGGKTNGVTLKFAADKAQTITYYNALISPRTASDGNPILPNKPRTTNRKAWLIPLELWGESEANDSYGDDTGDGGDAPSGDYQDDGSGKLEEAATAATDRYHYPVAAEIPVLSSVSATQKPHATNATSFKEEKEKGNSDLEIDDGTGCPTTHPSAAGQK